MQRTNSLIDSNKIISLFLILLGAGGFLLALSADALGLGAQSRNSPNQVALLLSGSAILTTGFLFLISVENRKRLMWVIVAIAAFSSGFAADLFIIGGLPNWGVKAFLIAALGLAIGVGRLALQNGSGVAGLASLREVGTIDRAKTAKFALLLAQLGLLTAVMGLFKLESPAIFHNLMLITFFGFLFNFILPKEYRLTFFLFVSITAIVGLFGLDGGGWMIVLGAGLIALANLPIRLIFRIAIILAATVVLVLARVGTIPTSIPPAIWPILGSLFMFRMIVYLYDLSHKPPGQPVNLSFSFAYFFLLPNLVFPLFPVVDYGNFHKKYYDKDEFIIYQTGARWMMFGVIQLIAYRFINYYLVISPQEVANIGDLVHYLATNFLLIVRITGQFHLAIGILLLFGFNLPIANYRYLLSISFTDFWRRANIYWKDFMLKVFYYPSYFRLKPLSDTARLVISTIFVFLLTWGLHSYQWFWLRGTVLISVPDILYWAIFGILILANSLYETRHGRKRTLGTPAWDARETAGQSVKVLGMFVVICLLWGLWTSPTVAEYLGLLSAAVGPVSNLRDLLPIVVVVVGLVGAKFWYTWRGEENQNSLSNTKTYFRTAAVTTSSIFLIFALGLPAVNGRLKGTVGQVATDLTVARLSDRDAELLLRGYYEDLVGINRFNTELWEVYNKRPTDWPRIQDTEGATVGTGFRSVILNPSISMLFHGAQFTTNQWGMRDQEYSQTPAPGTYRIALLGPSFVMGSGVADQEVFDAILEDRLNSEASGGEIDKFEILNFGVAGDSVAEEMYTLETRALDFQPNAIFLISHQEEMSTVLRNLSSHFTSSEEIPYEFLNETAQKAEIESSMPRTEIERRLQPYEEELTQNIYQHMADVARENNIRLIWVFMPTLEKVPSEEDISTLFEMAENAGFEIVSLADLYEGKDLEQLIVAQWDRHPNAIAHRMIADLIYERIFESGMIQNPGP